MVASYTDGQGASESVTSSATSAVANVNDNPTGSVTISGTATEDQALTAANTLSDEDGLGTISYQWQRGGANISGATSSTYTLTQSDVGSAITVDASYIDGQGSSESESSLATSAVANVNDNATGSVTISGTANEDQTLTAANTLADEDGLGTISYQWQRGGANISGATNATYILTQSDVGSVITVVASYTDGQGASESVTSSATSAVANVNDNPTGSVTISGTATEDQTLTAANTLADEDGLGSISYQWQRGGANISGATSSTYTLTQSDVGSAITVVASYIDGQGSSESESSLATSAVANVNDNATGSVTISGTATEDQTLTAANTLADEDGLGTISYQWQRGGANISGATNATYILTQSDVGSVITVVASYADAQGTAESATSTGTAEVANLNDPATGTPSITGTPTEDQTLSVDASGISDADGLGTFAYQWLRDGSAISGSTGSTYTLTAVDVNSRISVTITFVDGNGTSEGPLVSNETAVVAELNRAPTEITLSDLNVQENFRGASVGTLGVLDPNVGDTHLLTVSDSRFEIVGNQLKLRLLDQLDAAITPSVTLTVTATDQAGSGLAFTKSFTIMVTPTPPPIVNPIVPDPSIVNAATADRSPEPDTTPEPEPEPEASDRSSDGEGSDADVDGDAESKSDADAEAAGNDGPAASPRPQPQAAGGSGDLVGVDPTEAADASQFSASEDSAELRRSAGESDSDNRSISDRGSSRSGDNDSTDNELSTAAATLISAESRQWDALDDLRSDMLGDVQYESIVVGFAMTTAVAVTVGQAVWVVNAGYLASSALLAVPAWRSIDPLPVLDSLDQKFDDDDESLESMLDS